MPSFGGGGFSFGVQTPHTAYAPPSAARGFGGVASPNAEAIRAAMPSPSPEGGVDMALQALLGEVLGGMGAAGSPPPAAPPPPVALPMAPQLVMDLPMGAPPTAMDAAPPSIGITQPDERFVQSFRAENGRYPTPRDFGDRAWTMNYFRTQGRWPTQLEFLMQVEQVPTDGEPEYDAA